jgi:hypothetical protein
LKALPYCSNTSATSDLHIEESQKLANQFVFHNGAGWPDSDKLPPASAGDLDSDELPPASAGGCGLNPREALAELKKKILPMSFS